MTTGSFLPPGFEPPSVIWQSHYRIRPLRLEDADIDYDCYMSCVDHVRTGGFIQPPDASHIDWPRHDQTRRWSTVLIGHAEYLMAAGSAIEYGIFNLANTEEYGCLYVRPTRVAGYDAAITFWIREGHHQALDGDLYDLARQWIPAAFPFERAVAFPGHGITWEQWEDLPRTPTSPNQRE